MKRWILTAVFASTAAGASPLGVAWQQRVRCPSAGPNTAYYDVTLATDDALFWIEAKKLVRSARATGVFEHDVKLATTSPRIYAATADLVLVGDTRGFALYDAATLARRWRVDAKLPTMDSRNFGIVDGQIAYAASRRRGKKYTRTLELLDSRTGKPRWKTPLPGDRNISWIGGGGDLVYVISNPASTDNTITAYSVADGHEQWSHAETSCSGARVVGRDLVYEHSAGLVRLDEHGTATSLALQYAMIDAVMGTTLYATTNDLAFAIDLPTMKVRWQAPHRSSVAKIVLGGGSVYLADDDVLGELDDHGKVVASFGIADETIVGAPGKPALFECDGSRVRALDSAAKDVPVETTTVTGTIDCKACAGEPIAIRIGDVEAKTDARGEFSVQVTGRGSYFLTVGLPGDQKPHVQTIVMDGSKRHDLGTLQVEPEPEGD